MRIWDLPAKVLCNRHLLAEHGELHGLWKILTTDKGGSYRKHPETLRWIGKLEALVIRHMEQVLEFNQRGYKHKSNLDISGVSLGSKEQNTFIHTVKQQKEILRGKHCHCNI